MNAMLHRLVADYDSPEIILVPIPEIAERATPGIEPIGGAYPQVRAGKLRAIALLGAKRSALLPDVPTAIEAGVAHFEVVGFYGFQKHFRKSLKKEYVKILIENVLLKLQKKKL